MGDPRAVRMPGPLPTWPYMERCPACGEDGNETSRCLSYVAPKREPTAPRMLACGACGHREMLPPEYRPITLVGSDEPSTMGDYVAWRAKTQGEGG